MSAAVKGSRFPEVRDLIRTFKGMMSIHESTLAVGGDGLGMGPTTAVEAAEPEALDVDSLGELAALQGVVKFPVRIKCATLSWNTLAQGLDERVDGRPVRWRLEARRRQAEPWAAAQQGRGVEVGLDGVVVLDDADVAGVDCRSSGRDGGRGGRGDHSVGPRRRGERRRPETARGTGR